MRPKRRTPRNRVRQRRALPTLVSCKGGPGEVKTPPSEPSTATEKAPKKGSQTKDRDKRGRQGHMSPSQCQWAQQEVEGQRQKEGTAKVQRLIAKQNLGVSIENSRSPRARMLLFKVPIEVTAQVAGEGPKARATAAPKGNRPKMVPAPLARKTEALKGPEGSPRPPHPGRR